MTILATDQNTGQEIDLSAAKCAGCGADMAGHECPGRTYTVQRGAVNHVNVSHKGVARGKPKDKIKCEQCGGAMHYNLGKGLESVLCAYIQMGVARGLISDPLDARKLPALVPGDGTMTEVDDYAQANSLVFGKAAKAAGVATSYSAQLAREEAERRAIERDEREAAGLPPVTRTRKPKKNLEATLAAVSPVEAVPAAENGHAEAAAIAADEAAVALAEKPSKPSATERKAAASNSRKEAMKRIRSVK